MDNFNFQNDEDTEDIELKGETEADDVAFEDDVVKNTLKGGVKDAVKDVELTDRSFYDSSYSDIEALFKSRNSPDEQENTGSDRSLSFSDGESPIEEKSKVRFAELIYEWIDASVFSLIIIAIIFTFFARQVQVDGPSMENTLRTGNRLIMTNFMYTPKKGDIVIVNRYSKPPLIKRVIAVAGDTIAFDDEKHCVIVNGEALENEKYTKGETYRLQYQGDLNADGFYTLKNDELFIMGDNRSNSEDSRNIGVVHTNDIMGKAIYRFFPLSEAGGLG